VLPRPVAVLLCLPRALERPDAERPRALEPPARELRVLRVVSPREERLAPACVRPRPPVLRFAPRLAPAPRWRPPAARLLPPDEPRPPPDAARPLPDEPRVPLADAPRELRPTPRERPPPRLDAPRPAPRWLPPRPPFDDRLRPLDCLAI
jgi:hypothetical protein